MLQILRVFFFFFFFFEATRERFSRCSSVSPLYFSSCTLLGVYLPMVVVPYLSWSIFQPIKDNTVDSVEPVLALTHGIFHLYPILFPPFSFTSATLALPSSPRRLLHLFFLTHSYRSLIITITANFFFNSSQQHGGEILLSLLSITSRIECEIRGSLARALATIPLRGRETTFSQRGRDFGTKIRKD